MGKFTVKPKHTLDQVKNKLNLYILSLEANKSTKSRDKQKCALANHLKDLLDNTVLTFDEKQKNFENQELDTNGDLYKFYQYTLTHLSQKMNDATITPSIVPAPVSVSVNISKTIHPAALQTTDLSRETLAINEPPVQENSLGDQQYIQLDSIISTSINPLEKFISDLNNYKNSRNSDSRGDYYSPFMHCWQFNKTQKVNAVIALIAALSPPAKGNANAAPALTRTLLNPFKNKDLGKIVNAFLKDNSMLLNDKPAAKTLLRIK